MANSVYDFATSEASSSQTGGVNTAEQQSPGTVNDALRKWKQLEAAWLDDLAGVNTVGGTATAVTVTTAQGFTAYGTGAGQIDDGTLLAIKMGASQGPSTGDATLNVNSIGTKKIRRQGDAAIQAGDWLPGSICLLRYDTSYDSATGAWVLLNPTLGDAVTGSRLINGNGIVNQRTYTTVADDTYWCDRHYVLAQTAAITPTILSDVQNGLPSMMRLTQSQASAQRMGNAQIIESINCRDLRGQTVSLIGKLRCSSAQAIRYAILEWTGTADSVTSDVVNDWTSGTFTAGNFFISTTTNVLAVGSVTPVVNTVTDFVQTATVGSSANNLIVIIWTEGTATQNVTLDVAWSLHRGNMTGRIYPLEVRPVGVERLLCERYLLVYGGDRDTAYVGTGFATNTTVVRITGSFRTKLRAAVPAISTPDATKWQVNDGATNKAVSDISDNQTDSNVFNLAVTSSSLTQFRPYALNAVDLSARLYFEAEL